MVKNGFKIKKNIILLFRTLVRKSIVSGQNFEIV